MIGRPKNRRKPSEHRVRLPTINWARVGVTLGALAASAAAASAVSWAFDQPIETVAVEGRFQRVGAGGRRAVVKEKVHRRGLLSVDLAAVRRAIHTLTWVDSVSVQRGLAPRPERAGHRADRPRPAGASAGSSTPVASCSTPTSVTFRRNWRSSPAPTARSHWWRSAIWPRKDVSRRRACAYRNAPGCTRRLEFDLANGVTCVLEAPGG